MTKNTDKHSFFKEEAGVGVVEQQLLLNMYDIAADVEKLTLYIWQDKTQSNVELSAEFNELMGGNCLAKINISEQLSGQNAVNLLEVYRHRDTWKVRCVLQGYSAGLAKLLADYQLANSAISVNKPERLTQEQTLNKTNQSQVNTAVNSLADANIQLSWQSPQTGKKTISNYFLGDKFKPISDLRIGCFYELANAQIGIVYSFENEFKGSFEGVPYISASRSTDSHLERLDINNRFEHKLNRYLIFVTMMEAYDSWNGLGVEVKFHIPGLEDMIIAPDTLMVKPIYAVAMLDFSDEQAKVTPLNEYFNDLSELNRAFGWGLPFHSDQPDDGRENHRDNEED